MYPKTLTLAAVLFASATPALAAGSAAHPPTFAQADSDHNHVLERREINAIGIPYAAFDTNHDGLVTRSEYEIGTASYTKRSAIKVR